MFAYCFCFLVFINLHLMFVIDNPKQPPLILSTETLPAISAQVKAPFHQNCSFVHWKPQHTHQIVSYAWILLVCVKHLVKTLEKLLHSLVLMLVSLLRDFKLSDFTLISSFPDRVDRDIILIVSDSSRHRPSLPHFVQHVTSHLSSWCIKEKSKTWPWLKDGHTECGRNQLIP